MSSAVNILIKATDQASHVFRHVGREAKELGTRLIGLEEVVGGAVASFTAFEVVKKSLEEFGNAEETFVVLEAILKSTGHAAGLNADEIRELGEEYQRCTKYEDDFVIGAAGVLATFTQVKNEVFKQGLAAALDLSTVLKQDLQSSIIQIGKALNDPISGMTALRRVGVSFTEAQREQIHVLQESGDLIGAQTIILKELQTEFGGAAEAAGSTFNGEIAKLDNSLKDLFETIGKQLAPATRAWAEDLKAVLNGASGAGSAAVGLSREEGRIPHGKSGPEQSPAEALVEERAKVLGLLEKTRAASRALSKEVDDRTRVQAGQGALGMLNPMNIVRSLANLNAATEMGKLTQSEDNLHKRLRDINRRIEERTPGGREITDIAAEDKQTREADVASAKRVAEAKANFEKMRRSIFGETDEEKSRREREDSRLSNGDATKDEETAIKARQKVEKEAEKHSPLGVTVKPWRGLGAGGRWRYWRGSRARNFRGWVAWRMV